MWITGPIFAGASVVTWEAISVPQKSSRLKLQKSSTASSDGNFEPPEDASNAAQRLY
jgi:hypothetical protein